MKIFAETERLILRELTNNDAEGMLKLNADPEVHRYLGKKPINSLAQSEADIMFIRKQYIDLGIGRWAVIEKETNTFLGWCGLKLITEACNNEVNYYDLGYRFIKQHWGKGFATESASAALSYGFNQLQLEKIIGIADVENLNSIKVLKKLGLQQINIFDYDGKPHYWMKIEAQDF